MSNGNPTMSMKTTSKKADGDGSDYRDGKEDGNLRRWQSRDFDEDGNPTISMKMAISR